MKAAVQVLKKAEELKQKVSGDILNDNEAWNSHQKLQDLYQQLLVIDLEYALDKKVEQDLWNYVFKNQINLLQIQAKDRKNPQRIESQENLVWFLEAASGFYLQLLQELCETFDLDIPSRRKGSIYGITREIRPLQSDITPPHKSSCLYICQHCLVHLGDIARYRNQSLQAETFYRHAAELVPSNGQPYNQLAILEAAKGDKLSTVFYYVRSIAVKYPFPVATTNLQKMLSKIANDEFQHEGKSKLSVYDYVTAFLQFHALVHLTADLDKAQKLGRVLASNLTILIATESLSAWKLIQMTAINLFSIAHATHGLETATLDKKEAETEALSEEEQTSYNLVLELIASTLNGLLLLVYTMKEDSDLKSYYALPVIKLILEWLRQDPSHLKASSFTGKLQIWPSFCKLLNAIQSTQVSGFDYNKYVDAPLPEDWDLQSFLPLYKAYRLYQFKESLPHFSNEEEHTLRAIRLVALGHWLCEQEIYGVKLMTVQDEKDGSASLFEAITPQTPSSDVLKQLEDLSLSRATDSSVTNSVISVNGRQNGVLTTNGKPTTGKLENGVDSSACITPPGESQTFLADEVLNEDSCNGRGKVVNRLHQGFGDDAPLADKNSVTKEGQNRPTINNSGRERKTRQNVALQTIMQRKSMNTKNDAPEEHLICTKPKSEGKQVTFKTPSPSPPASSSGTPPLPQLISSTPSPIFPGDMTSGYSPLHSPSYVSQQKMNPYGSLQNHGTGNAETHSTMGSNTAVAAGSNVSATRMMYSGLPSSDPNYVVNSSNKYGLYGSADNRPYPSHNSTMPQPPSRITGSGMGQRVHQQAPRILPQNKECSNPSATQQAPRIGMMGVNAGASSAVSSNGTVLTLPQQQHGIVYGYSMANNIGNQHSPPQPSMAQASGPQSSQNRNIASKTPQQVSPYSVNPALFGQTSQPPWFAPPQSPIGIPPPNGKAPNFDQLFPQLNRNQVPPPPLHQGGQMAYPNMNTNPMMASHPIGNAPRPHFPISEANPFLYQIMSQMPDQHSFHTFPQAMIPQQAQHHLANCAGSSNLLQSQIPGNLTLMHQMQSQNMRLNNLPAAEDATQGQAENQPHLSPNSRNYDGSAARGMHNGLQNLAGSVQRSKGMDKAGMLASGGSKNFQLSDGRANSGETMPSIYSLFNSPWSSGIQLSNTASKDSESAATSLPNPDLGGFLQPGLQSLWSGPGPSPLERLLEQQKQKKDPAPH